MSLSALLMLKMYEFDLTMKLAILSIFMRIKICLLEDSLVVVLIFGFSVLLQFSWLKG